MNRTHTKHRSNVHMVVLAGACGCSMLGVTKCKTLAVRHERVESEGRKETKTSKVVSK